jgi:hypothetical protein
MKSQGALDPVTSDLVRNYNSFTNEINADGLNFSHVRYYDVLNKFILGWAFRILFTIMAVLRMN